MNKIEREKKTIELMIRIYCKKKHKSKELCEECKELLEYAHKRLSFCKFGEEKTTCGKCPIHCYKPDMREKIRAIMRWAGPRMIIYDPIAAIRHILNR
jgi:hypothetical protein